MLEGVIRSRVGYSGGKLLDPTYRSMLDHTECIQVDFDPRILPLEHLVDLVFGQVDPFRSGWGKQYAHAIYFSPAQEVVVRDAVTRCEALKGKGEKIAMTVELVGRFYNAEDYHQQYYLRNRPEVMRAVGLHKDDTLLRESHQGMRLNSWLSGHGDLATALNEIETWKDLKKGDRVIMIEAVQSALGNKSRKPHKCI